MPVIGASTSPSAENTSTSAGRASRSLAAIAAAATDAPPLDATTSGRARSAGRSRNATTIVPFPRRRQRVKIRALLASKAACVRLLTLILAMIAAMCVLTVASAIESS